MNRWMRLGWAVVLGTAVAGGCTSSSTTDEEDAGGGVVRRDSGNPVVFDAGKTPDASLPEEDAGIVDAGDRPRRDGGGSSGSTTTSSASTSGGSSSSSSSSSSSGGSSGTVTQSSSAATGPCTADSLEPNDTPAAGVAVATGNYDATLCPQDVDYFKVTLAAGQSATFTITFNTAEGDLNLYTYQADGTSMGQSTSTTGTETVTFNAGAAGAYFAAVRAAAAARVTYRLAVALGQPPATTCTDDALEPNDAVGAARPVNAGALDARVCPSDPDFFKLDLNVGDRVDLTLTYTQSAGELDVEILKPDETVAATGSASSGTETLAYTAAASGTHYVRVFGRGTAEGAYTLRLAVSPAAGGCQDDGLEQNDSTTAASAVAPGTLHAVICNGDDDFFAVEANAGDTLAITLTPGGGAPNLDVKLLGPGGAELAAGSQAGADTLSVTVAQSGRHIVRVFAPAAITAAAAYDLVIARTPGSSGCTDDAFEDNDSAATARALAAGTHTAFLCASDEDFYKLTLAAGDEVAAAITHDAALDVDLFALAADGTVVDQDTAAGGSQALLFTAATAGDYLVRVTGPGGATGAYQLQVTVTPAAVQCTDDGLEQNDTRETARALSAGENDAHICAGDDDFYGVVLNVGDALTATITFDGNATDLDMVLFSPTGAVLTQSDGVTGTESVTTTATAAGSYVFQVLGYGGAAGAYHLAVTVTPAAPTCTDDGFEENDTAAAATTIGAGTFTGTICPSDDDFFKVTLNAQDTLKVDLALGTGGDLDLRVLDGAGAQVASSVGTGSTESITWQATAAGTYTIRINGFQAATNTYSMVVRVDPAIPSCTDDNQEENDSAAAARTVTPGTLTLRMCPADEDFFGLDLVTGDTLRVTTASGVNIDVQLRDAAGTVLGAGATAGGAESVTYTATAPGRVVVRVFGAATVSGDYTLTTAITPAAPVCTDDAQEQNDTAATAATVTAQSYPGLKICSGDDDFYAVQVAAGATVTASITFTHASGDLDLQLLDPAGAIAATSAGVTGTETVTATATAAGRYVIRAYGYNGAANTYALNVTITGGPPACTDDSSEQNDTAAAATPAGVGTRNGTICPSDPDFFSLALQAGQTLTAELRFTHANGDLDLRLTNAGGTLLGSSTGVTSVETITYTATATGTYFLEVRGYLAATNTYALSMAVASPPTCTDDAQEQNDTVAAAKTLPASGAALQICANDDDWFKTDLVAGETLEVTVTFTQANGDIDARLYDLDQTTLLDTSLTSASPERLTYQAGVARTVYLRVNGVAGAENAYTLTWTHTLPSFSCPTDDPLEENDTRETATTLARDVPRVGQICAGDADWYAVGMETGDALVVTLTPNNGAGDLDLYLISPQGSTSAALASSENAGGAVEEITYTATKPGTYFLRIIGYSGASNRYALNASVTAAAGACQEDEYEENDTVAQAFNKTLTYPNDTRAAQICANDEDLYEQYAFGTDDTAPENWVLTLKYDNALGDLDLYVVNDTGAVQASSLGISGTESITFSPATSGWYYARVKGFSGAFAPYTLISAIRAR